MTTRFSRILSFLLTPVLLCGAVQGWSAFGQATADSLRKAYDFKGAVDLCERSLKVTDSTRLDRIAFLEQELVLAQNGLSMAQYCSQPEVVAKHHFSLKDFFLYYPMENQAWRPVPNQLDSLGGEGFVRAMYVPQDAQEIYYSARDADGFRNLYRTALRDSIWSVPQLINENLTSSSDEIYPFVTRDGKSLYFASKGLYGMGGYDLYVSNWNEHAHDWDPPVNLGFPFSSPYDDFLFINSDDGLYTVFASNRECGPDSVCVYVLSFDSMPVRKEIRTVDGLKTLCRLDPRKDAPATGNHPSQAIPEDENIRKYIDVMDRVRGIRDSLSRYNAQLDRLRTALKSEDDPSRQAELRPEILESEIALPARQKRLAQALGELQKIEMDVLSNGIVIDPDKLRAEADREVVGTGSSYVFTKNAPGPALRMMVEKPLPSFDYSFKILDVGQFAEDNTLPEGLVYQIQLFATSRKATEKDLKGLSPVFERKDAGGKNVYSVGLFRTYSDVLSRLNKVKSRGFKGAAIVAFDDGKMISVSEARKLESSDRGLYKVRIWPEDGQSLPEAIRSLIADETGKDILRSKDGAAVVYEVGPFSDKASCTRLASALQEAGAARVAVAAFDDEED